MSSTASQSISESESHTLMESLIWSVSVSQSVISLVNQSPSQKVTESVSHLDTSSVRSNIEFE